MENYEVPPTGRITYRQLREHLNKFSQEQLDMDVTVEYDDECYAGELRICDKNHDSLDEWHPVLYIL